jgi:hypothetical protein
MKKFVVAAALALMFIWTPEAQAQDMTVANYQGTWTPIGQLPAGVRHVTKDAMDISVVLQIEAKRNQGQLVMGGQQYQWKNIVTVGDVPVDSFSFGMELRPDYWVSCKAQREGWLQMSRRAGPTQAPQAEQGRPDQG